MLAAALGSGSVAQVLVAGAGGGAREIVIAGALEPQWRFTAGDPSQPMMGPSVARPTQAGLFKPAGGGLGTVYELSPHARFDAATPIGVLHHFPRDEAKR